MGKRRKRLNRYLDYKKAKGQAAKPAPVVAPTPAPAAAPIATPAPTPAPAPIATPAPATKKPSQVVAAPKPRRSRRNSRVQKKEE